MKITEKDVELLRGLLPEWEFERRGGPDDERGEFAAFCMKTEAVIGSEWFWTCDPRDLAYLEHLLKRALRALEDVCWVETRSFKYRADGLRQKVLVEIVGFDHMKVIADAVSDSELRALLDVLAQMEGER